MPFKSGARHLFPVLDLIPSLYLNSLNIFPKETKIRINFIIYFFF